MDKTDRLVTASSAETQKFFRDFSQGLKAGDVVGFRGELGAGKTTAVQAILDYFGVTGGESPTFVLMRTYSLDIPIQGIATIVHIDAYRLHDARSAETTGMTDVIDDPSALVLVEWGDRIADLLPKKTIWVDMMHKGSDNRQVTVARP